MNLRQAINVLNANRHHGSNLWTDVGHGEDAMALEMETHAWLLPADAIALAEQYERAKSPGKGESTLKIPVKAVPALERAEVTIPVSVSIGNAVVEHTIRMPLVEFVAKLAKVREKKGDGPA